MKNLYYLDILTFLWIVLQFALLGAIVFALVLFIRYLVKKNRLADLQLQEHKNKQEKPLQ